jgi:hypothetical protein
MTVMVDRIAQVLATYSLLDVGAVECVSESCLSARSKKLPMAISAGKKRDYETAFFFKNARALARIAKQREADASCPVGAVLFRDADGTRATERGLFEQKWKSIDGGFAAEEFRNGVPMVPKPKSEAWLLCALKTQAYQGCADLEETLSGNDHCPNPAKQQLDMRLQQLGRNFGDLNEMVKDGTIDAHQIDMPSFTRFKKRLEDVVFGLLNEHP